MPSRCFIALTLEEPILDALTDAGLAVVAASPAWKDEKWVARRSLHVTLVFIGPYPDASVAALVERVRESAAAHDPFGLPLEAVRAVPDRRRATMLWASLGDDAGACASLQRDMAAAAAVPGETRPFRPHVTLARARRARRIDIEALTTGTARLKGSGKDTDGIVSVRSVTLFASTLGPAGPSYETLATCGLRGVDTVRSG